MLAKIPRKNAYEDRSTIRYAVRHDGQAGKKIGGGQFKRRASSWMMVSLFARYDLPRYITAKRGQSQWLGQ